MSHSPDIRTDSAFYTTDAPHAALSGCSICFKSVIGGAIAAAAISLVLAAFGSGLGLAFMSPYAGDETTIAGFTAKMAIWIIIMQWLSSAFGGYLAGRLRKKWNGVDADEVFFRDTAHGLLTWAVATFLVVTLVASAATSMASGGVKAATAVASAGAATAAAGPRNGFDATGYAIDTMFRTQADQPVNPMESRGETNRIFMKAALDGEINQADRDYLAQVVAKRTNLSQGEAEARVNNAIAEVEAAKEKAKQKADEARKAASAFSIFTALSLLIGAFIAAVASVIGGCHRDNYPVCRVLKDKVQG